MHGFRLRAGLVVGPVLVIAGCGSEPAVVEHTIDASAAYVLADSRPLSEQLTAADFGEGYPATYVQEDGGTLVVAGDGTGRLDGFAVPFCLDGDVTQVLWTGEVYFSYEFGWGTWLVSRDGGLLFNFVGGDHWEYSPYELIYTDCEGGDDTDRVLTRVDE